MGNRNFKPKHNFNVGDVVNVDGNEFSLEHVPEELKKNGNIGKIKSNGVLYQSRPTAPKIYVSRVQMQNGYTDLYFTSDLIPYSSKNKNTNNSISHKPLTNSGSRVVNKKYGIK